MVLDRLDRLLIHNNFYLLYFISTYNLILKRVPIFSSPKLVISRLRLKISQNKNRFL